MASILEATKGTIRAYRLHRPFGFFKNLTILLEADGEGGKAFLDDQELFPFDNVIRRRGGKHFVTDADLPHVMEMAQAQGLQWGPH